MWTKRPEPQAVIGPSLPLICLVIRHHVSRGCPSPESETHEECPWTQPVALRDRNEGTEVFLGRGLCGDHYLLHQELRRYRPAIGVWCSARAVTSTRHQVSSDRLAKTLHHMFCGRPPRPRRAFVCPLDTGGLIRVRRCLFFSTYTVSDFLLLWSVD